MTSSYLFKIFFVYLLICISTPLNKIDIVTHKSCSRAQSSIVRQILHKIWKPIFHEYGMKLSKECPLHFSRDIYKYQELAKLHYRVNLWTCGFCGKSFFKENNLDFHIARSHSHHTLAGDEAVCLADYCDIFRCKGFELDGDNSIFNETNGKSSNSDGNKALVVGPPQELAFLINAGEREINSEAYIGLSGDLDSLLKKRNSELNNEGKETSSKPRDREFTKKRRSSIIEDLDNRAPPNDDDHHESFSNWLFHPEIKEKCDTIMMEDIHIKCQKLIDDCTSPLLFRLSSEEYKAIYQYLDQRICWYLTCERYRQFLGSKKPSSSLALFLILGLTLALFLAISYYVVWFCF